MPPPWAAAKAPRPAAPPVYRPNNALSARGAAQLVARPRSSAPPVYRPDRGLPQAPPVAGRSAAAQLSPSFRSDPPPVYRPTNAVHSSPRPARAIVQRAQYHVPPGSYSITTSVANEMTKPFTYGEVSKSTSRSRGTGVSEGEIGSYAVVQHLEKVGDNLTGDHQPSGAAVKEALREALHQAKLSPLTRLQARYAYQKAITIMVTDAWHKAYSRTYGGRNNKTQIAADAADLIGAAKQDFDVLAAYFLNDLGLTQKEVDQYWSDLHQARIDFFSTGKVQSGTMN